MSAQGHGGAGESRIDGLLDAFLTSQEVERNLSAHSIRAYASDLRAYLDWTEREGIDPLTVSHRDVRRYLAYLDQARYSRRTVNRHLSALRGFYRFLVAEAVLSASPLEAVAGPKQPKGLPRLIPQAEMDAILNASDTGTAKGLRDQAILETLYASGVRIGEMATLSCGDVDFGSGHMRVLGKGSKERIVPLHPLAVETLRRYLRESRPELVGPKSGDALFLSTRGNPMSTEALRRVFKDILTRAGVDQGYHPHDVRHTFATDLLEGGADLRSVQEMLGHASLSTTQIYTHLSASHLKDIHHQSHPRA